MLLAHHVLLFMMHEKVFPAKYDKRLRYADHEFIALEKFHDNTPHEFLESEICQNVLEMIRRFES